MEILQKPINLDADVNVHLENKKISRHFFMFLWFMYAIVYMTKSCFNGALSSIVAEGILTKSQTGFITAMFYVVYAPLQIVGGMMADKRSPELLIKIGLIGAAISNIIIYFNQSYYVMLAAWVFNGMIQFGVWPGIFKIISSQLIKSDRKMMSYYISFPTTIGLMLSYLLAAVVPHWRFNFLVSAILLMAFPVGLHIYEKHLNPYMKWDRLENCQVENVAEPIIYDAKGIFLKSGFFLVAVSLFFAMIVEQSKKSLSSIMFVENYDNVSPSLGNILTVVLLLSGLAGTLIAGRIVKFLKNELPSMALLFTVLLPILFFCSYVGSVPIASMVVFLCISIALEAIVTVVRTNYTMGFAKYGKSGTAAGILNGAMSASFIMASFVIPLLVENFGWRAVILIWFGILFVSVSLVLIANIIHKKFIKEQSFN